MPEHHGDGTMAMVRDTLHWPHPHVHTRLQQELVNIARDFLQSRPGQAIH